MTPILGILCCGALIATQWEVFVNLIPYFIVGFAIYFFYGQHHSKLRNPANLLEDIMHMES